MEIQRTELIDDGTKRDRRGRRLMSPERVAALVGEYEASGLTQAEFARRAGVKYQTFACWVKGRRGVGGEPSREVRFAEVQLPAAKMNTSELSVMLPDGLIVRGADIQALAELVRALRT